MCMCVNSGRLTAVFRWCRVRPAPLTFGARFPDNAPYCGQQMRLLWRADFAFGHPLWSLDLWTARPAQIAMSQHPIGDTYYCQECWNAAGIILIIIIIIISIPGGRISFYFLFGRIYLADLIWMGYFTRLTAGSDDAMLFECSPVHLSLRTSPEVRTRFNPNYGSRDSIWPSKLHPLRTSLNYRR